MSNHPDAYLEHPTHVLYAGRCLTTAEFVQAIHPCNPAPLPRDDRGEIAPGTVVRVMPTPYRPCGGDGATVERFPGVQPGRMKEQQ